MHQCLPLYADDVSQESARYNELLQAQKTKEAALKQELHEMKLRATQTESEYKLRLEDLKAQLELQKPIPQQNLEEMIKFDTTN